MIPVLVFFGHTVFACYAFAKAYQNEGLLQAFLNIAFIIILFTVGWTISDLVVGFFISEGGYQIAIPFGKILQTILKMSGFFKPGENGSGTLTPKDSISLIVLSVIEFYFYRFLLKGTKTELAD